MIFPLAQRRVGSFIDPLNSGIISWIRHTPGSGWGPLSWLAGGDAYTSYGPPIAVDGHGNAFAEWGHYNIGAYRSSWSRYMAGMGSNEADRAKLSARGAPEEPDTK